MKPKSNATRPTGYTKKMKTPSRLPPEIKHFTVGKDLTALDTPPSSSNPALYCVETLINTSEGDGQTDRTGIKIQCIRIEGTIKVAVDPNSDASNSNIVADAHLFRVVLIQDRHPNGAGAGWPDVFQAFPNNEAQEFSFMNPWFTKRFNFIMDKYVRVPPSYVTHDGTNFHAYGNFKYLEFDYPLNFETLYSDNTNNLTAIQGNNLFLIIAADASSTSYTKMKFSYRIKTSYMDY